ncbi:hypothetical protein [Streptomyces lydicus]|uniref:hypothetical protein n=1 Tax=Streptomyces lydicus TaxID=47763 RepID=UPI00379568F4
MAVRGQVNGRRGVWELPAPFGDPGFGAVPGDGHQPRQSRGGTHCPPHGAMRQRIEAAAAQPGGQRAEEGVGGDQSRVRIPRQPHQPTTGGQFGQQHRVPGPAGDRVDHHPGPGVGQQPA